jgi:hypothetical protein
MIQSLSSELLAGTAAPVSQIVLCASQQESSRAAGWQEGGSVREKESVPAWCWEEGTGWVPPKCFSPTPSFFVWTHAWLIEEEEKLVLNFIEKHMSILPLFSYASCLLVFASMQIELNSDKPGCLSKECHEDCTMIDKI